MWYLDFFNDHWGKVTTKKCLLFVTQRLLNEYFWVLSLENNHSSLGMFLSWFWLCLKSWSKESEVSGIWGQWILMLVLINNFPGSQACSCMYMNSAAFYDFYDSNSRARSYKRDCMAHGIQSTYVSIPLQKKKSIWDLL